MRDDVNADRDERDGPDTARGTAAGERSEGPVGEESDSDGDGADSSTATTAEDAQRTLDELRDRYLRLAAEFDNYRRRTTRERQEAGSRAQADLIKHLVDSLDDLARVTSVEASTTDVASVVHGVDLVEKKLMKALTSAGLEVLNPVDQSFDPARHEAVRTEPALSPEDDHLVARVYQPGYLFNGQLLRPARVVVKQWNG